MLSYANYGRTRRRRTKAPIPISPVPNKNIEDGSGVPGLIWVTLSASSRLNHDEPIEAIPGLKSIVPDVCAGLTPLKVTPAGA
jgi:hypothetical protein